MQIIMVFLLGIGIALLFSLPFAWFVMLLWNFLMGGVFAAYEIPTLAFWEAWCLYILCSLLFKSANGGSK